MRLRPVAGRRERRRAGTVPRGYPNQAQLRRARGGPPRWPWPPIPRASPGPPAHRRPGGRPRGPGPRGSCRPGPGRRGRPGRLAEDGPQRFPAARRRLRTGLDQGVEETLPEEEDRRAPAEGFQRLRPPPRSASSARAAQAQEIGLPLAVQTGRGRPVPRRRNSAPGRAEQDRCVDRSPALDAGRRLGRRGFHGLGRRRCEGAGRRHSVRSVARPRGRPLLEEATGRRGRRCPRDAARRPGREAARHHGRDAAGDGLDGAGVPTVLPPSWFEPGDPVPVPDDVRCSSPRSCRSPREAGP